MLIRIDSSSPVGLAEQIAAEIRTAIASRTISSGDRLPVAKELAAALGVNMHTVLAAYSSLRDAGIVEMRQGRGTRVLPPAATVPDDVVGATRALVDFARTRGVTPKQLAQLMEGHRP